MLYNPPNSPTVGRHWYVSEEDLIILADGRSFKRPERTPAQVSMQ